MCPRILAFVVLFLMPAIRSAAQVASGTQIPDIPRAEYEAARVHPLQFDSQAFRMSAPDNGDGLVRPSSKLSNGQAWRAGPLSIGPFRMDIGSSIEGRDGKSAHFAHLHLDNVHILGGDVSGTFDGRAATLRLSWPTGN